jgi:uncharacterized protein YyaL (SSP411 family)
LTPDSPFFGGTYFPPEDREGMKGFVTVLTTIHTAWEKITRSWRRWPRDLPNHEGGCGGRSGGRADDPAALARGAAEYKLEFDEKRGGFGIAPKFPRPAVFHFLLRYHFRTGDADARRMTLVTLDAMARGGMHDHLGGGFHRYSTDPNWFLPHFEKMLYDQGQSRAYLDVYQLTHDQAYATVL